MPKRERISCTEQLASNTLREYVRRKQPNLLREPDVREVLERRGHDRICVTDDLILIVNEDGDVSVIYRGFSLKEAILDWGKTYWKELKHVV